MEVEYFPPTPTASDTERQKFKMTSAVNGTNGHGLTVAHAHGAPSASGAPARVTLHLGHLPSKKNIKAPYPRSPSRVGICANIVSEAFFYAQFLHAG